MLTIQRFRQLFLFQTASNICPLLGPLKYWLVVVSKVLGQNQEFLSRKKNETRKKIVESRCSACRYYKFRSKLICTNTLSKMIIDNPRPCGQFKSLQFPFRVCVCALCACGCEYAKVSDKRADYMFLFSSLFSRPSLLGPLLGDRISEPQCLYVCVCALRARFPGTHVTYLILSESFIAMWNS